MTTDTEKPPEDADAWEGMGSEAQDEMLQDALEDDSKDVTPEEEFSFAEQEPEDTESAIQRIQEKTQETWHGVVLDDVTLEFYRLQEKHINLLKEMASLFARIQDADDTDDLSEADLDTLQEADEELEQMLAEVTVDEELTVTYWEEGEYPADLKLDIFSLLFKRYKQGGDEVDTFQ